MNRLAFLIALVVSLAVVSPAAAATLYMAPGASGTACTTAAPCGTMEAAYRAASLGDTVELKAGSYSGQTVAASASKGQPDAVLPKVTFRPAPGAAVTFTGGITLFVPHVAIEDVAIRGTLWARYRPENPALENSGDVHFRRLNLTGGRVMFNAVKNFSLVDSEITGLPRDGIDIYGSPSGVGGTGHYPSNGLIEGNWIHDLPLVDGDHIDGIQFTAGQDIVVRNNTIGPRVHHQDMLLKSDSGPVTNITVSGNTFHPVVQAGFSFMAVKINGYQCSTIGVSANNFLMNPTPRDAATQCSGTMSGNTFRQSMSSFHCSLWKGTFSMVSNAFPAGEPCGTVGTEPTPTPTPTPTPSPTPSPTTATASFSYGPTSPSVGQTVSFDGRGSTCAEPCTYTWTDDGPDGAGGTNWTLGTGAVYSQSFGSTGTKYVRLTVRGADGQTATTMKQVVVADAPAPVPTPEPTPTTASFTYGPTAPKPGKSITFDGRASSCAAPCTYTWTDDGPDGSGGTNWSLGTGSILTKSFGAGTKYIRLTVRGADGRTATTMKQVVVK